MNKGTIPGLNADGWRSYRPRLLTAGSGGETQPFIPDSQTPVVPFGRYNIIDHALAIVEIQISLTGSALVLGTGSAYVLSLPFPANRWTGEGASSPVPLGVGMCYISGTAAPFVNVPTTITLADPYASLAGQEDLYVQCYCPYILSWGGEPAVFPVNLAGGVKTITHQCGYAPRAEDIDVTFLDAANVSAGAGVPRILNITSTTFDVVAGSTATAGFEWKVRGKPPTGQAGALMGPNTPWDWTHAAPSVGSFGNIFLQLAYEPKF